MLELFEDDNFNEANLERRERAIKALNSSVYLQKQTPEDMEEFFVQMLQKILADNSKNSLKFTLSNVGFTFYLC